MNPKSSNASAPAKKAPKAKKKPAKAAGKTPKKK